MLRCFLAFALCSFALSATAQDMRRVSGTATYLQRIVLPPEAEIAVEATGFNGESLGHARQPTEGAQVPLPFALDIPERLAAEIRVAIFAGGMARWVSDALAVPPGSEDVDLGEIRLQPYRAMGFSSRLDCGGTLLELGYAGDKALLRTAQGVIELAQVPAASGARFASADGTAEVWTKGDSAIVTLDDAVLPDCRMLPPEAPRPWTARGNEPGWVLTLEGDRLAFAPFGGDRVEARLPEPAIAEGAFVYDLTEPPLRLAVADSLCRDSMTGMPHPQSVTVETGGRRLTGCGGAPIDLLAGREWVVEDVQGGGIIDASRLTLLFARDGRVSGSGGCNRFTGRLTIGGEALSVGPLAATMMACAEALMRQERRFFDALAAVDALDIQPDGALLLMAAGQTVVVARR